MKNTSEIVGLTFPVRLASKIKQYGDLISYFCAALLSLLLSNSVLFAQIAPFGVAVCAAASGDLTIAATLGAVLGYLVAPSISLKMKYIAAVLIIGAIKWALVGKNDKRRLPALVSLLLPALVLGGTGLAILCTRRSTTYEFVLLLCEVLLASGATYFFSRTLAALERREAATLRQSDLSCLVITFGLLVVALCPFSIEGVSIGRVLAALAIMICALRTGESGGAIGGITAGVAVCLSDSSMAFLMGAYGLGGMLAGVFGGFGRFGCAAAFIVVNGVATALAALIQPMTLAPVIEVFIASVIFIALPGSLLKKLTLAPTSVQTLSADSVKSIILNRLYFTRKALGEISVITEQVSEKLQKLDKAPFDLNAVTADRVCKKCPKKLECWQNNFNTTSAALNDMTALVRHGKTLIVDDIPGHIRAVCQNPQGLISALSDACAEQRRTEASFAKNVQLRSVVLDQWSGIEQLIGNIASDVSRIALQNERTGSLVRDYLLRRCIRFDALSCYEDNSGHTVIEITVPQSMMRALDKTELTIDLSEICEREFSLPRADEHDGTTLLIFCERAGFGIRFGASQICATGKRLCGDSYKCLDEFAGSAMAIISDGMGNGSLAAIDSSMAASLISRLVEAGIGLDATLKLVNSAMLIKSGDESLATVDICTADLYKGSVTLYKAGAAPSYIKKSGRVGFVESASLPAGILNSVEFEQTTLSLSDGDIVVLVSDGVTQTGEDWMLDELERFTGTDMQALSERLASMAKLRRTEIHDDDITVLALTLCELAS